MESKILSYFSPGIQKALKLPELTDIFINNDTVFVKTQSDQYELERVVGSMRVVINEIANYCGTVVNVDNPILEVMFAGFRITATIPPISARCNMSIRKPNPHIIKMVDYIERGQLSQSHYEFLSNAISNHKNILVVGGTGSGKTTFSNALLDRMVELSPPGHRIVILEDIDELQCSIPNQVKYLTSHCADMTRLLKVAMRSNPERILVGEVRDKSALDLLKSWNTGSPGGIATIHANGCEEGLQRIIDLAMEAGVPAPFSLVQHTVDVLVFIESKRTEEGFVRKVKEVASVTGFNRNTEKFSLEQIKGE
jgi:P-type conjugative transfer ATPase TrbB|tara:strand:- start:40723 stop:41652 length:930 start_codon:yes stop_codon:yes gene_type:complete